MTLYNESSTINLNLLNNQTNSILFYSDENNSFQKEYDEKIQKSIELKGNIFYKIFCRKCNRIPLIKFNSDYTLNINCGDMEYINMDLEYFKKKYIEEKNRDINLQIEK